MSRGKAASMRPRRGQRPVPAHSTGGSSHRLAGAWPPSGIGKAILTAAAHRCSPTTDDAMRLTTVRDLLAGQGWWDHIQHRLNAPYGAEIHWSHLVDAAEGGVMPAAETGFAGGMAETIAVYAGRCCLLLALLVLCGRLAFRLAGRGRDSARGDPADHLARADPRIFAGPHRPSFDSDPADVLTAWAVSRRIERPRFAMLAGIAAALQLAIGYRRLA